MFTAASVPADIAELRDDTDPRMRILDCEQEFETMPSDWVYELALITEDMNPLSHPAAWVPESAPSVAQRTTGRDPVIGMPDDGSVAWTRQTDPALIFIKPRADGLPEAFLDFLIAEAIIELGLGVPETPVCFFKENYADVHSAIGNPTAAWQLAAALRRAWIGLQTRDEFDAWSTANLRLHGAWVDAGERLVERIDALPSLLANEQISFLDATELACNALKHDLDIPTPYDALDVDAFAEQGAPFAIQWIQQTVLEMD